MKIYNSSTVIDERKTCVALGNFDGVHLGHQRIISTAIRHGRENGYDSCVYTFDIHPTAVLGNAKKIITTNDEKIGIIENLGCDSIYFENFESVRNISPKQFCESIIRDKLNASCVICGENYRFGSKGAGNTDTLKEYLSPYGINVIVVPYATYNGKIISSTEVRGYIENGDMRTATLLLGHDFTLSGCVAHGKRLGRKLGFPTLNIPAEKNKVVPKFGVYTTECLLGGKLYKAVSNVGIRPTTDSNTDLCDIVNCETFLMGFSGDAYGETITVYFKDFIRPEMKFDSVESLKERISTDVSTAKEYFEAFSEDN